MSTRTVILVVAFFSFMMLAVTKTLSDGVDQVKVRINDPVLFESEYDQ